VVNESGDEGVPVRAAKFRKGYITFRNLLVLVDSPRCRHAPMPECDYCGAHVSERFERVFADEYGRVFACPDCSANAGIAEAAKERAKNA
jgi:hypothetical protein